MSLKTSPLRRLGFSLVLTYILLCLGAPHFLPSSTFSVLGYIPPVLIDFPLALLSLYYLYRMIRKKADQWDRSFLALSILSSLWFLGFEVPSPQPQGQASIRVLTINVEKDNRRVPGLMEEIRARNIDLVFMQEVKGGDQNPASRLARELEGWHVEVAGEVAILSKFDLSNVTTTSLRSLAGRYILSVIVNAPKPFRAVTTHWSVPQFSKGLKGIEHTMRSQELDYEDTESVLESSSLPTIFGGDLNNPPRHSYSNRLSNSMKDAFSEAGTGFGYTYPASFPIIRIDHLFCSDGVHPRHAMVGPSFGSDHRSLIAEFSFD